MKMVKRFFSLVVCLFITTATIAQIQLKGFVFPEFTACEVTMKNGNLNKVNANYDAYGHRFLVKNGDGNYTELGGLDNIVMVILDKRVFVPVADGVFYEQIPVASGSSFYVQYRTEFSNTGTSMPFGGATQTTAAQGVSNISSSSSGTGGYGGLSGRFEMNEDPNVKEKIRDLYYLKDGVNFKQIISVKSLTSLFKPHKEKIEAFAKNNKTKFTQRDDVIKILEYCFSL